MGDDFISVKISQKKTLKLSNFLSQILAKATLKKLIFSAQYKVLYKLFKLYISLYGANRRNLLLLDVDVLLLPKYLVCASFLIQI